MPALLRQIRPRSFSLNINIAVRPESYRTELDKKVATARAHADVLGAPVNKGRVLQTRGIPGSDTTITRYARRRANRHYRELRGMLAKQANGANLHAPEQ